MCSRYVIRLRQSEQVSPVNTHLWPILMPTNCPIMCIDLTNMLMKRMGIMIKKMIHRMIEMMGNKISLSCSLSPLGDRRKIVSKLKSPAVIDRIFSIELAGV